MCGTLADASVAGGDRGVVALPMVSFFSKSAAQVEQAGFPIVRGQSVAKVNGSNCSWC